MSLSENGQSAGNEKEWVLIGSSETTRYAPPPQGGVKI